MSDTVLITLIIAVAVIVILFMFRKRLSSFGLKANKDGIETELKTNPSSANQDRRSGVNISGNKMLGKRQTIDVGRSDVNVEDNRQIGTDQQIIARPDPATGDPSQ